MGDVVNFRRRRRPAVFSETEMRAVIDQAAAVFDAAQLERELGAHVVNEYTPTSYTITGELTFDEWERVGVTLHKIASGVMWWLGDWWVHGERLFGDDAFQGAPSGYASETARKAAWVCARVHPDDRRPDLSFGHHDAVASLPAPAQVELLARAAPDTDDEHRRPRLNIQALRAEARRVRDGERERVELPVCPTCGQRVRRRTQSNGPPKSGPLRNIPPSPNERGSSRL
jgi:hypothetical protein